MFTYTYVYIVQKRPSPPIQRSCRAHKVDTSPAFRQYHAEEIGYTTPIIFNWGVFQHWLLDHIDPLVRVFQHWLLDHIDPLVKVDDS